MQPDILCSGLSSLFLPCFEIQLFLYFQGFWSFFLLLAYFAFTLELTFSIHHFFEHQRFGPAHTLYQ